VNRTHHVLHLQRASWVQGTLDGSTWSFQWHESPVDPSRASYREASAMKRRKWLLVIGIPVLLMILGLLLLYAATPRTGYCFDSAFDRAGERLYVTGGRRGLHVFRVAPEGSLTHATTYFEAGYYRYVEVVGDHAYVANSYKGLEILDISSDVPRPVWAQDGSKCYGAQIQGDKAYLVCDDLGLQIFDIADQDSPHLVGHLATIARAWDVWVRDYHAFVADHDAGLIVVDASTPSDPREVGSLSWGEDVAMAEVIDGADDHVYVASGKHGLIVIDVSEPSEPVATFQYDPGLDSWGEAVLVQGDTLYLSMVDSASREENGLHVFDLHDPSAPELLSKLPVTDGVEGISVAGGRLALANTMSGVVLIDIHSATDPLLLDTYPSAFWRSLTQLVR